MFEPLKIFADGDRVLFAIRRSGERQSLYASVPQTQVGTERSTPG